jgi:hypothetical protein
MAVLECLARGWTFQVDSGGWATIGHIDTFSMSDSDTKADTTTFDDAGAESHLVAARAKTVTLKGKYQVDESTGARDAGQEAVEAWAALIGQTSLKQFRITDPSTSNTITFWATAAMGDIGGGNNDPTSWACTVTRSGGNI